MVVSIELKRGRNSIAGHEVVSITGPLDDGIISAILHTGASIEEIRRASVWLDENHHTRATADRLMGEKTRRVYEILDYARHVAV